LGGKREKQKTPKKKRKRGGGKWEEGLSGALYSLKSLL
jgi:hypothetical protein